MKTYKDGAERPMTLHVISVKSQMTGVQSMAEFYAYPEDYSAWKAGKLIQEAMPYLTDTEREHLISGMTPAEQERFFTPYMGED